MVNPESIMSKERMPDTKGHILYNSIYLNYPDEANTSGQKTDEWLPWAEGRGNEE